MRKSGLALLAMYYCDFREDQKKNLRGLLTSVLFWTGLWTTSSVSVAVVRAPSCVGWSSLQVCGTASTTFLHRFDCFALSKGNMLAKTDSLDRASWNSIIAKARVYLLKTVFDGLEQVDGCAIVGIKAICRLLCLRCQKNTNIGENGTQRIG